MQFDQVQLSAVALVLAEAIFRKTGAEVAHNFVPRDLRDHACRRDAETVAVAVDDGGLWQGEGEYWQAVDENVIGLKSESGEGDSHRLVGGAENIDRIDLHGIDDADRPGDGVVADDILVNLFPFLRQELFRIVQLPMLEFFRENDGGRDDRTSQGAASSLINAGNSTDPDGAQLLFMSKAAATVHAKVSWAKVSGFHEQNRGVRSTLANHQAPITKHQGSSNQQTPRMQSHRVRLWNSRLVLFRHVRLNQIFPDAVRKT